MIYCGVVIFRCNSYGLTHLSLYDSCLKHRLLTNLLINLGVFLFDFQTYVNLEVYDDKDYVNFDVLT